MIFVTVGAQMPFDRLIAAVDKWALVRERTDVFAQIGPSRVKPMKISASCFLEPQEFRARMREADLIVAHAGMGTIISALEYVKPIIVMPRRGDLMETRNDHQVATAKYFEKSKGVMVALDEISLTQLLDNPVRCDDLASVGSHASDDLIATIRSFIGHNRRDGNQLPES